MFYIILFAAGTPLTCKIIIPLVEAIGVVAGLVLIGFVIGIIHYHRKFMKIRYDMAEKIYYHNVITNLNERP